MLELQEIQYFKEDRPWVQVHVVFEVLGLVDRRGSAGYRPGMALTFIKEVYGKATVLDALKAGGWKAFLDGTLA